MVVKGKTRPIMQDLVDHIHKSPQWGYDSNCNGKPLEGFKRENAIIHVWLSVSIDFPADSESHHLERFKGIPIRA